MATHSALPLAHALLAIIVVAIWGSNFVVIHEGLQRFPPFTFAALRFALASVPLLWIVPMPKAKAWIVAAYGVLIGLGQFGMLLFALAGHIAPGLASLLVQTQAFFTVALAVVLGGEHVGIRSIAALLLCAAGVFLIIVNTGAEADILGVLLVLGAALSWAGGNIIVKRAGNIDTLGLIVWSSAFAAPPLALLALAFEGSDHVATSLVGADLIGWATLAWQSFGNTLFGYGVWNWLLSRHRASAIAPLGLLVPFFGMTTAAFSLGEAMPIWKLGAAALVIAGLALNLSVAQGRPSGTPRSSSVQLR